MKRSSWLLAALFHIPYGAHGQPVAPAVTVVDLIEMTRFGSRLMGGFGGDDSVVSPDHRHVAVVTQRGNLARNVREFSLLIFRTADFHKKTQPETLVRFSSSSNRPAISQLAWLSDNETLAFIGEQADTLPQVYSVNIQTKELTQRTRASTAVATFKVVGSRDRLVYAAEAAPADPARHALQRARGFAVPPTASVAELIAGYWGEEGLAISRQPRELRIIHGAGEAAIPLPDAAAGYGVCYLGNGVGPQSLTVAPSGDVALVLCTPRSPPSMPTAWQQYRQKEFRRVADTGDMVYPWWIVLDLHTGRTRPLTGAPSVNSTFVPVWIDDGRSVVLVNEFLPLEGVDQKERERRATQGMLAEVDVQTGQVTVIARRDDLSAVEWDAGSATVTAQVKVESRGAKPASVYYRRTMEGWTAVPAARKHATQSMPALAIEEGLDEAWKLVAVHPGARKKRVVYDPNPGLLTKRRFARQTQLRWMTKSGAELVGGLYWPLDYVPGRRYPLLIQTHGFDEARFSPDGASTTGYAAQPLAGAGLMVVQAHKCINNCDGPAREALSEGQREQESLEALIDHLDALALIERDKVGMHGYSRTCFHVLYFLTQSQYPMAAASCADGVDFSYLQHLVYGPVPGSVRELFRSTNGGEPFGPALETWLERAPGFNLHRVSAPLQMTALGDYSGALLTAWEPYAGLLLQGKPAELVYIPQGKHNLVRPWERFTSQQGAVDWYRFWLQSYERKNPRTETQETLEELQGQYARWRKLRELHQVELKKPRSPRLKWTATVAAVETGAGEGSRQGNVARSSGQ